MLSPSIYYENGSHVVGTIKAPYGQAFQAQAQQRRCFTIRLRQNGLLQVTTGRKNISSSIICFLYFLVSLYNYIGNSGTKASNYPVKIEIEKRKNPTAMRVLWDMGTLYESIFTIFYVLLSIDYLSSFLQLLKSRPIPAPLYKLPCE